MYDFFNHQIFLQLFLKKIILVTSVGFKPATSGTGILRSIQLNYEAFCISRCKYILFFNKFKIHFQICLVSVALVYHVLVETLVKPFYKHLFSKVMEFL